MALPNRQDAEGDEQNNVNSTENESHVFSLAPVRNFLRNSGSAYPCR